MPVPGKPKVIVQDIPYDVDMAPEVAEVDCFLLFFFGGGEWWQVTEKARISLVRLEDFEHKDLINRHGV